MNSIYAWSAARRYALSIGGVLLTTLALTRLSTVVQVANVALYLLVVLLAAVTLGRGPAIVASLLAFLGFNFFFVEPRHSLNVTDPQDVLRLVSFLVVAIIGSSLAGRARAQAKAAARASDELAAMYDFSQKISAEVDLERILPLVARTIVQQLDVAACSVLLYDSNGRLVERAAAGPALPEPQRRMDAFVRIGPRVLGVLRVTQRGLNNPLTPDQRSRLDAIASQVGLVLERARLSVESSQIRAQAESERMKATLLSSVSHDLRSPLAAIKGATTSLLDDSVAWQPEARRALLISIDAEADRLNRLVGNLLDMSRLEAGAPGPARSLQDIGALIEDVVERMRRRFGAHSLEIDLAADLPPAQASYAEIEQVLTNLIENAAGYSPAGTPIAIRAYAEGDSLAVAVCDHGPGIPEGLHARIFEKFVRMVGPDQQASGAGLGLAICKSIVEAHGGRIWAENAAGGGARFIFTLPIAGADAQGRAAGSGGARDAAQAEGAL
jgi:two-component system sensor histidine kinase KdpD